jgi:hypothetical protein
LTSNLVFSKLFFAIFLAVFAATLFAGAILATVVFAALAVLAAVTLFAALAILATFAIFATILAALAIFAAVFIAAAFFFSFAAFLRHHGVFPMCIVELIDERFFTGLVSSGKTFPLGLEFLDSLLGVGAFHFFQINFCENFGDATTFFLDQGSLFFSGEVIEVGPLFHHLFAAVLLLAFGLFALSFFFVGNLFGFLIIACHKHHAASGKHQK